MAITTTAPKQLNDVADGELSPLEKDSAYSYEVTKYPLDLGTSPDNLHHVVFYINLPESSKYLKNTSTVDVLTASQQNFDFLGSNRSNESLTLGQAGVAGIAAVGESAVKSVASMGTKFLTGGYATELNPTKGVRGDITKATVGAGVEGLKMGTGAALAAGFELRPKLKRLKECIAIYMPDTVQSEFSHNHQGVSLTEAQGKAGEYSALGAGIATPFGAGAASAEARILMAQKLGAVGAEMTGIALKSRGFAINPQVEMIYKGTDNRRFIFEFRFQPRSKTEALAIKKILRSFRRWAAPELFDAGNQNGRYFIPPAQFDIKFFFMNKENDSIFKISTCVLTNISSNYSGAGQFATFEDGFPAEITMQLMFTEADIIYRELIEKFGY